MIADEWFKLRKWNRTQNEAFEELCSQIFRHGPVPEGSVFSRFGTPDGGIETICTHPDGTEIGLQAKYFTSMGKAQWQQLDDSVIKAIKKYPKLTIYKIAIPLNRPNPKIPKQKSMMDKWAEHVQKWQAIAKKRNMSVQFEYIGGSELLDKLSTDDHAGRLYFWFEKEYLSSKWFKDQLQKSINLADQKYSADKHVSLEIEDSFDYLSRDNNCCKRINNLISPIIKFVLEDNSLFRNSPQIIESIRSFMERFEPAILDRRLKVDLKQARVEIDRTISLVYQFENAIINSQPSENQSEKAKAANSYKLSQVRRLLSHLYRFQNLIESSEIELLNNPLLLLSGPWGQGKTHTFCHVAEERVKNGLPTILLLGQKFSDQDPWQQIFNCLGLQMHNEDQFLGALQAAAEASQGRALLMIDALNETGNKDFWATHLPTIMTSISNYPLVGLAVSVRDVYENDVMPCNAEWKKRFVRLTHSGFAGVEEISAQRYCSSYGIEPIRGPLTPTFSKPQLLKLYCQSLANDGLKKLPDNYDNASGIFSVFIDSINNKLSRSSELDFSVNDFLVQKAVSEIAKVMATKHKDYLDQQEAKKIVNSFLPGRANSKSLYHGLIKEGILSEDNYKYPEHEDFAVRFSYQKLTDHLITRELLKQFNSIKELGKAFTKTGTLYNYISPEQHWRWAGVIEALSIQLPEKFKVELLTLVPRTLVNSEPLLNGFLNSLLWRSKETVFKSTFKIINANILNLYYIDPFFDISIQIAGIESNPFNASELHKYLSKNSLSARDYTWSSFLSSQQYENETGANRLINWSLNSKFHAELKDSTLLLYGITITWFFSTSNRSIRDRSTKALTHLLEQKPAIWIQLLNCFQNCNDPYVLERLYAVGCGIATRTHDKAGLRQIGQTVYDVIFANGKPLPHVLIRNYARTIVEAAVQRGGLKIDRQAKLSAPFAVRWNEKAPSEMSIKQRYLKGISMDGYGKIWYSLTKGDFGIHKINNRFPWSGKRRDGTCYIDNKAIYEKFISSFTNKQAKAWHTYQEAVRNFRLNKSDIEQILEIESAGKKEHEEWERSLTKKQLNVYKEFVLPWLSRCSNRYPPNISLCKRWMFARILNLGWKPGLFEDPCTHYLVDSRMARAETISDKYQWIAYHEMIAHMMDNYEVEDPRRETIYGSECDVGYRDIDPSCLITKTAKSKTHTEAWWCADYDFEEDVPDLKVWAHSHNIPDPVKLLDVKNPADQSEWLVMSGSTKWRSGEPNKSQNRWSNEKRSLSYYFDAYFIKKSELVKFHNWATRQNFFSSRMPEPAHFSETYLGEYPWSKIFNFFDDQYYLRDGWIKVHDGKTLPGSILVAADGYYREDGNGDKSIIETLSFRLPSKWIIENMKLVWNRHAGYLDSRGNLVAYDPSVDESGPSCLLMNKQCVAEFCNENGYSIVWILSGEKLAFVSGYNALDERLIISGAYKFVDRKIEGVCKSIPIFWTEYCREDTQKRIRRAKSRSKNVS